MKTKKILAVLALAFAATGAQASLLVANGSFEDQTITSSYAIFPSISGWTGGANGIEIQRTGAVSGVSAFDGNQYVELDTTGNSSMWQSIATSTGNTYTLSFAYMGRPDNGGGSQSNKIEVWWDGKLLASSSGKGSSWNEFEFANLTAASSSTRLEFRAAGASDSYGGLIDGVVVTSVPEPETYALMLAGLGLMGTIARRRKSKAA